LNPHLAHFFYEIGLPIYEGWGMTEACPITVNTRDKFKIGTVGPPLPGMEVVISPEGELLVRGPNVMVGYYLNREATRVALDDKGWLHTGDKGVIDDEGFVKIIGRMKELYKTSTGEYVAPVPIEQELCKAPFIDLALVIAEGRKYSSCLLFPDFEVLRHLKVTQHQESLSDAEFLKSEYIISETQKLIDQVNAHLNHWEAIRTFRLIPAHLEIEKGDLTPTLKIIREAVIRKYQQEIDAMYPEDNV
jgi:long-chain acyl-CoA synthetase